MEESVAKDGDRRRSPRFSCGGRVTIYCLPYEGMAIPGVIRNLSSGGICLNAIEPLPEGSLAEVVVSVNGESFRAVALVKGPDPVLGTRLQFTQMSAFGQDVLLDLIARLDKMQSLNRRLRAPRTEKETARLLTPEEKFRVARAGADAGVTLVGEAPAPKTAEQKEAEKAKPVLIRLDLFI